MSSRSDSGSNQGRKRKKEALIAFEKPLFRISEFVNKYPAYLFDEDDATSMTKEFKNMIFNIGKSFVFLHFNDYYHGKLKIENTYVSMSGSGYIIKLSGLQGLSPKQNRMDRNPQYKKDADWCLLASMIEVIYSNLQKPVPPALGAFISNLKDAVEKEEVFFRHPLWWCFEDKLSLVMEADLTWNDVIFDQSRITWPQSLMGYLANLGTSRYERHHKYKNTLSSFVHFLKNKLTHPEFFGLFPYADVEGNAERFLSHIESCWPNIWTDLLTHKAPYQH